MEQLQRASSAGGHQEVDLVNDGWTDIIRTPGRRSVPHDADGDITPRAGGAGHRAGRLREDGADPRPASTTSSRTRATAEALKPYYRQFCKRPCFHDEYLPTLQPAQRHAGATPTARASSASPRPACVVGDDASTRSTASSSPSGFEVGTDFAAPQRARDHRSRRHDRRRRSGPTVPRTLHGFLSPRLPELLLHRPHPDRLHRQLDADDRRAGAAHRLTSSRRDARRAPRGGADAARPRTSGRPRSSGRRCSPATSSRRARPATTTTRATSATPPACGPVSTAPARRRSSRSSATGGRPATWTAWRSPDDPRPPLTVAVAEGSPRRWPDRGSSGRNAIETGCPYGRGRGAPPESVAEVGAVDISEVLRPHLRRPAGGEDRRRGGGAPVGAPGAR